MSFFKDINLESSLSSKSEYCVNPYRQYRHIELFKSGKLYKPTSNFIVMHKVINKNLESFYYDTMYGFNLYSESTIVVLCNVILEKEIIKFNQPSLEKNPHIYVSTTGTSANIDITNGFISNYDNVGNDKFLEVHTKKNLCRLYVILYEREFYVIKGEDYFKRNFVALEK